jgi:hypothetical protein
VNINLLTPDVFLIVEDSETAPEKRSHRKSLVYLDSEKKREVSEDEDDVDDDSEEEV